MRKKDLNNGVLIGISSSFSMIKIQNGYGIETILSNDDTKAIIDLYFIPFFKNGDFFEGTKTGTMEIMKKLE